MNESQEHEPYHETLEGMEILRREAGEGWHPEGLNPELLAAIVAREAFIDTMAEAGINPVKPEPGAEEKEPWHGHFRIAYYEQLKEIYKLKDRLAIGEPPPLPLEED